MMTASHTPVEQAEAHVADIQNQLQELYRTGHVLAEQASAARQAGDNPELERLSQLIRENHLAYRIAGGSGGGKLDQAKQALTQAQNELWQAQRRALDTNRAARRFDSEIDELEQHLVSLKSQRAAAQQSAQAAQDYLSTLEPPTPAAPVLVAPAEPAPVVAPTPPEFPPPTRTLQARGEPTRYFNDRLGLETDRDGRPLDVQPEPPTPHKPDPNAAQTAPSLY